MHHLPSLELYFVAKKVRQNFEGGYVAAEIHRFRSHCSMNDGDLKCWNQTLHFYEKILLAQLRHYVAVQVNIDQWHKHHDEHYTANFTALKDEAIRTFDSALSEDDIINSTTISAIVSALIDRVQAKSDSPLRRTPHFSCPLPCEYRFNLWRNLFIASSILIVGLLVAIIPFIRSMIVSDSRDPLIK
ncbi:unnamed protein product [Toxocara canis]|uniref:RGS domain-containing protein n=1 Tax=Toxocara canis TaxID=6265 RepID=A0A183UNF3_TOXCA|nr:unnamed protein product [Toxocara canis]